MPARAAALVVTSASDVVNGDTSSPAALAAQPGPDGISLREAILAAHNIAGPHTIGFSPALAGQTIVLTSGFPITRDGIAIVGVTDAGGKPTITLDAGAVSPIVFSVVASDFTLAQLRIVRFPGTFGVWINAGNQGPFSTPPVAHDITVEGNEFSNEGMGPSSAIPVTIGTDSSSNNARVANVRVARNRFTGFSGNATGVHIHADGAGSSITGVTVSGNTFTNMTFGVEFVAAASFQCRIDGPRVIANTFIGNEQPINLNHFGDPARPASTGNVIDGTRIESNLFLGNRGPVVVILPGMINATGNTISNTEVVNNVIARSTLYGGVDITGGRTGGRLGHVSGVRVVNNTIAFNTGNGVDVNLDPESAGGNNTIDGVSVMNTLFRSNSADVFGIGVNQVSHSLTDQGGFAGANGNVTGDPRFADALRDDYHLLAGSPAIDAGASIGAPLRDFDCRSRVDDPATPNTGIGSVAFVDIGAFEFSGGPADCDNTMDADGDGIPNAVELSEGRDRFAKDNDIFNSARLFAMQQYRDFLGREGDIAGVASWTYLVDSGVPRTAVVDGFFSSAEFQAAISPVARLYFAFFLRIPDYGGLRFWVDYYRAGNALSNIASAFVGSQEFLARYGALTNSQFVDLVYQNVLGRPADAGGKSFWLGQLNGGMTRGEMMIGFSESAEYKSTSFTNVYVTMMYVGMLKRSPDQGGFDFWTGYINGGNSGQALINGFLVSTEYHNRFLP